MCFLNVFLCFYTFAFKLLLIFLLPKCFFVFLYIRVQTFTHFFTSKVFFCVFIHSRSNFYSFFYSQSVFFVFFYVSIHSRSNLYSFFYSQSVFLCFYTFAFKLLLIFLLPKCFFLFLYIRVQTFTHFLPPKVVFCVFIHSRSNFYSF